MYALRSCERYGVFRKKRAEEGAAEEEGMEPTGERVEEAERRAAEEEGKKEECPTCKALVVWQWVVLPAREWVEYCHARGSKALISSRWDPFRWLVPEPDG
jgi:hypothetical protein